MQVNNVWTMCLCVRVCVCVYDRWHKNLGQLMLEHIFIIQTVFGKHHGMNLKIANKLSFCAWFHFPHTEQWTRTYGRQLQHWPQCSSNRNKHCLCLFYVANWLRQWNTCACFIWKTNCIAEKQNANGTAHGIVTVTITTTTTTTTTKWYGA